MKTRFISRTFKATALAACMLFACTMSAFAKPTADVNKQIVKQFTRQFTNASGVSWKTTAHFTSATFTLNGKQVAVYYGVNNEMIGVSKIVTLADLPKSAQKIIENNYSNYNVVSVIDFTDAEGVLSYYTELNKDGKKTILKSDERGATTVFE